MLAGVFGEAQRAGMQFLPSEFSVIGSGASGPVRGKLVTIDRVTLGGKTVERVSEGYWTMATCRVSCASSRTVLATTSSR